MNDNIENFISDTENFLAFSLKSKKKSEKEKKIGPISKSDTE